MKLKSYQEKSIQKIVADVLEQLNLDGERRKIVFQAPTGAGKTVMVTEAMCRIRETIADSDCRYRQAAFIWIAPNELHIQSYQSMKNAFTETHRLTPVVYDELDAGYDGYIRPGEVLFVNWQSINKANNVMVRGSEQMASVYDIIDRTTREHRIPIVCVIDEEHIFAGEKARQSEKVLSRINPKIELRISATPKTPDPDAFIKIDRTEVIKEEMIKRNISLNPDVRDKDAGDGLDVYLLGEAMKQRRKLAEAYRDCHASVNPLLLIQLPNDTNKDLTTDEAELKEKLLTNLEYSYGATTENGKVAVWLSGEKTNLEGIERHNSAVDVLIFKQAIAMGWDCPRAAVLLIYRKLSSEAFTIQTVGRIMRMPQQHFYADQHLNIGYVYTDLSADVIKIEPDDQNYITKLHAYRRAEMKNVTIAACREERSNKENNVLRSDFKKVMLDFMAREWTLSYQPTLFDFEADDEEEAATSKAAENRRFAGKHINMDVKKILIEIPTDMVITDDEGETPVVNKTGYARTPYEIGKVFERYCSGMLTEWSKSKCLGTLQAALVEAMEELFEMFETDAKIVICSKQNWPKFADLIKRALEYYRAHVLKKLLKADRGVVDFDWTVPEERDYAEDSYEARGDIQQHAMEPYFEQKGASNPEKEFTKYLEENSDKMEWWYKNGNNGGQHFAVSYENIHGVMSCFYVDFIILLKDGTICLFDTKSCNSDPNAVAKNNALHEYVAAQRAAGKKMTGGIAIYDKYNWYYPGGTIEHTDDTKGWSCLDFDEIMSHGQEE